MDSLTLLSCIIRLCRSMINKKGLVWNQRSQQRKIKKLYCLYLILEKSEETAASVKQRKYWTRPIFLEQIRMSQGASNNLIRELEENDPDKFFNYLRMTPETFHILLNLIEHKIAKQYVVRTPITPRTRLEITLRYLASGDSMTSMSYTFRVGLNTVSQIILETCTEIWCCLKEFVLEAPTENTWRDIAEDFKLKWNFPHCVGAIDGKHIIIEAPPKSGSKYYNYKNSHSIVLLAVADANLCFSLVDIGAPGRQSDSGIFHNSNISKGLESNNLNLPESSLLVDSPQFQFSLPYVFVGDEAFALSTHMMRPYPRSSSLSRRKKIFNYRLSRARRLIESAFGILSGRWRIFRRPINASVSTAIKITQATICLHNFIMKRELNMAVPYRRYSLEDCLEEESGALMDLGRTGSNTFSRNASNIRDKFAEYFEGIGAVHWQWEKVLQNDF